MTVFTWQLADKLLEVGMLQGPPQVGVSVQLKRIQVEPHRARKQDRILDK